MDEVVPWIDLALPLLLILMGFAMPLNAQAHASFVETIKRIQMSVCPVGVVRNGANGGPEFVVEGTAFFVRENGEFVTALHVAHAVLEAAKTTSSQRAVICVPYHGWPRADERTPVTSIGFTIVRSDPENDVALCRTDQNPFREANTKDFVRVLAIDDVVPPDGTEVVFIGFPSSNMVPMAFRGFVSTYQNLSRGRESGPMILI